MENILLKRDKRAHCDKCNDWKNYMQAQKNELKEELSLNAWFIGEKLNREISELESQAYFLQIVKIGLSDLEHVMKKGFANIEETLVVVIKNNL
jgi:hypothetical protein